ncbi:peptidase [Aureococcus anophagefferens]|nr:peptidase [Aureococcus anophagefferens]
MLSAKAALRTGRAAGVRTLVTSSDLPNGVNAVSTAFNGPVASVALFSDLGTRSETPATNGTLAVVAQARAAAAGAAIAKLGGAVTGAATRDRSSLVATAAKATVLAAQGGMVEEVHGCAYLEAPYGLPANGTAASLANVTHTDAAALLAAPTAYTAVGVGCDDLAAFGALPAASAGLVAFDDSAAAIFTGSDKKTSYDGLPLAELAVAYEFPLLSSEFGAAATLLPSVLGAGANAGGASLKEPYNAHGKLLCRKLVRDLAEQGAAAFVAPFYAPYADTALFGVHLAAPDVRVEDAVWYTMNNLVRLSFGVTDAELARAKLAYKAELGASIASPAAVAAMLGAHVKLLGAPLAPNELLAMVEDVELDEIKALAYEHLHDCDHALAAVGPVHELRDYNYVRTASYNHHPGRPSLPRPRLPAAGPGARAGTFMHQTRTGPPPPSSSKQPVGTRPDTPAAFRTSLQPSSMVLSTSRRSPGTSASIQSSLAANSKVAVARLATDTRSNASARAPTVGAGAGAGARCWRSWASCPPRCTRS